jgi:hypothetical protein
MIVGVTFTTKPADGQVFEGFAATLWRFCALLAGRALGKAANFA